MTNETTVSLTTDPAWPWSLSPHAVWLLVAVGLLLAFLTIWTYRGQKKAGPRRVAVILALRLFALFLACLTILRPSLAFREEKQTDSVLLVVFDASASMTIQDEHDNQSRWQALQRLRASSAPLLKELADELNVAAITYRFAGDAASWDDNAQPDGKRTDFGTSLKTIHDLHRQETNLRGIVLVSDGADNGNNRDTPPLTLATRFRNLPCPVYTFALGKATTADAQSDIVLRRLTPEPSPVPVKGKLTIKALIDAPGFVNTDVDLHLFIEKDGKKPEEVLTHKETLQLSEGNLVQLTTDAPAEPGEIKLTLKADPKPGEVSVANNQISTYVSVTKEGISVLLVDKPRAGEPQAIADALKPDPRIRLYTAWLRTDKPAVGQVDLFQFGKQRYDVIIIGDVSVRRMQAGNPKALQEIHDLVADKSAGLLMMGGYDTLGEGGWKNAMVENRDKRQVPFVDVLPVDLSTSGQFEQPVQMEPTDDGLQHFVLRLKQDPKANADLWRKLPPLAGMSRLGKKKPTATLLATWPSREEPILVGTRYGSGRVLAFGGDTTWHWRNLGFPDVKEGNTAHARFWRQLVYWLAQQDKLEGSVWIKPDTRRVATGDNVPFSVGARGKGGLDLDNGSFTVTVERVGAAEKTALTVAPEDGQMRGSYRPTQPGEYRLHVRGKAKDADGAEVTGEATVRFLVYQDESELARRSADHKFLQQLAHAGGGQSHLAQELPDFLRKLKKQPLLQAVPRVELAPDWRGSELSPFVAVLLILFITALCLEWLLRRRWGLV